MDQMLIELLKTAPATAAVIFIVIVFIRYIERRDQKLDDIFGRFNASYERLIDEGYKVQETIAKSVDENSRALGRNDSVLNRFTNGNVKTV